MQRLFRTLLILCLLVGQLLLIEHIYEEHDSEQLCEICITSNQQDNAVVPALPGVFDNSTQEVAVAENQQAYIKNHVAHFSVRAPPVFLS